MNNNPIGIFDSGIGGTSIFKEVHKLLPNEDIIYLADSKNAPYGNKPKAVIQELSVKNTDLLLSKQCKLIIVACNTATTNAIAYLRQNYDIPFIGIEPAIKPAALHSKSKTIGILATKGTLSSSLFHNTMDLYAKDVTVIEQIGEGIVPLIENGKLNSTELLALIKRYMQPMIAANIDSLVLGCTHYPYLIPILEKILPKHVRIIDSGAAVAKQTKSILQKHHILKTQPSGRITFYTNGNTSVLDTILDKKYQSIKLEF